MIARKRDREKACTARKRVDEFSCHEYFFGVKTVKWEFGFQPFMAQKNGRRDVRDK